MASPDFLILGAQKAGTTWLADVLRQHPDIYLPPEKELHFFNKRKAYARGIEWYESHFDDTAASRRGEATPNYLWTSSNHREIEASSRVKDIPGTVHQHYPDLQFFVLLRDPVQRAISAYRTLVRGGYLSPQVPFREAIHQQGIVSMGFYETHIRRWMEYYPAENFQFFVFEHAVLENRLATAQCAFAFLGVNDDFTPEDLDTKKHPALGPFYRSVLYYAPWLRPLGKALLANIDREKLPFQRDDRASLVDRDDIARLRSCLEGKNRDLEEITKCSIDWAPS